MRLLFIVFCLLMSFSLSRPVALAAPFGTPAPGVTEEDIAVPPLKEVITDIPRNLKTFGQEALAPESIPLVAGVLAMTAVQVATDYQTWQAARIPADEDNSVRKLANYGVSMGDGYFQFGIVGGLAAVGGVTGNHRLLRTASQTTEAILSTGVVVQIIKHVTGRESPFSSESRTGEWRMFPNQLEYHKDFQKFDAVPSGHLSTAVTTYIVIQENYPDQKWLPFVGWPIIGLVSFGLAGTSIHWWSDFPIAVAIGYSFGKIVTRDNHPKATQASSAWTPLILPTVSSQGEPIIMAGWRF